MPNIAPLYGRGFPLKEKNQREARWQLLTKLAFGLDAMSSTAYFFSAGRRKRYDVSFFFNFIFCVANSKGKRESRILEKKGKRYIRADVQFRGRASTGREDRVRCSLAPSARVFFFFLFCFCFQFDKFWCCHFLLPPLLL